MRPIIQAKVEQLGSRVLGVVIAPDEREAIRQGVKDLLAKGIDLLVTTAGLSVDPDDVTRQGLMDAGATDLLYGAPILPGAMTLLARIGDVQVMGVPACALHFKHTSFDLLLPRLLAGLTITGRIWRPWGMAPSVWSVPPAPFQSAVLEPDSSKFKTDAVLTQYRTVRQGRFRQLHQGRYLRG